MNYEEFLVRKTQVGAMGGFEPVWMPDFLFDFQRHLVDWAVRKGRAAIYADCVGGETIVRSPDGDARIDTLAERGEPIRVWSLDRSGRVVVARATAPFLNGFAPLHRFTLESGRTITATMGHRFLTRAGWRRGDSLRIGEHLAVSAPCLPPSIEGYAPQGSSSGDPSSARRRGDSTGRCSPCPRRRDRRPHREGGIGRGPVPSRGDALALAPPSSRADGPEHRSGHSRRRPGIGRPSMPCCAGPDAIEGATSESPLLSCVPSRGPASIRTARRAGGGTILGPQALGSRPSEGRSFGGVRSGAFGVSWDTLVSIDYIRDDTFFDLCVPEFGNYLADDIWSHNCGLGKTPTFLVWAENVVRHTNGRVLVVTPLAVSFQVCREAEKFGIEAHRSDDGTPKPNVTVTNYERLPKFDPNDYSGVVCDEASILKHWSGATQKRVTRFLSKIPHRLLSTATPSPNAFEEQGMMAEAMGEMTYSEMLATFFRQITDDEKKKRATADDMLHSRRLSWRVIQSFGQWALRPHAFEPFWKWVASWARACRKPSDLGPYSDERFLLPPLDRHDYILVPRTAPPGWLFTIPAFGLHQERQERLRTLEERADLVAGLTDHSDPVVVWCDLNDEGDAMERAVKGAVQVKGSQKLEQKEELLLAFITGEARGLVTKTKIAGLGLNLQHCAHVVTSVTHSYEGFYQRVARCRRFGQRRRVRLDVIATEGEVNICKNLARKEALADAMFNAVIQFMNDARAVRNGPPTVDMEVPSWLSRTS